MERHALTTALGISTVRAVVILSTLESQVIVQGSQLFHLSTPFEDLLLRLSRDDLAFGRLSTVNDTMRDQLQAAPVLSNDVSHDRERNEFTEDDVDEGAVVERCWEDPLR